MAKLTISEETLDGLLLLARVATEQMLQKSGVIIAGYGECNPEKTYETGLAQIEATYRRR